MWGGREGKMEEVEGKEGKEGKRKGKDTGGRMEGEGGIREGERDHCENE